MRDAANSFVLQVQGSSMINEQIRDGDFVVIERRKVARDGETVVGPDRGHGGDAETLLS